MKLAIVSLVCSIMSIAVFWWLGIVGVFIGVTAICRYDGDLNEKGVVPWICTFGVLFGTITTVLHLVSYL